MMDIKQYSAELSGLANAHANYQLAFDEYRQKRKTLLDALDKNYNGVDPLQVEIKPKLAQNIIVDADKTQPYLASKIEQCISFLKKS